MTEWITDKKLLLEIGKPDFLFAYINQERKIMFINVKIILKREQQPHENHFSGI